MGLTVLWLACRSHIGAEMHAAIELRRGRKALLCLQIKLLRLCYDKKKTPSWTTMNVSFIATQNKHGFIDTLNCNVWIIATNAPSKA